MEKVRLNRPIGPAAKNDASSYKKPQQGDAKPNTASNKSSRSAELEALANSKKVTKHPLLLSGQSGEDKARDVTRDSTPTFNPPPSTINSRHPNLGEKITSQPGSDAPNRVWFVVKPDAEESADNQLPIYVPTSQYLKFGGPPKPNIKPESTQAPYFPAPIRQRNIDSYDPYGGIPDFRNVPITNGQPPLQTTQPDKVPQKPQRIIEPPEIEDVSKKNILPPMFAGIKIKSSKFTEDKIECLLEIPDPKRDGKTKECKMKFSLKSWGPSNRVKRATLDLSDSNIKHLPPDVLAQSLKLAGQNIVGQGVTRLRLEKPKGPIKESVSSCRVQGDEEKNSVTILMTDLSRAMDSVIASRK
jgi:hypothetical protein